MPAFGDFTGICHQTPLPLCAAIGSSSVADGVGIEATCFARNIELANTVIFQGGASAMHILALVMTVIMIFHIRGKFTAVGRREILTFFYMYMLLTFISLVVDAGVVPPGTAAYPYFAAIQLGLASSTITSLFINGFVGFQLYEDGTPLSVWLLRICTVISFAVSFLVSLGTFKSWAAMGPTNTIGLFVVMVILNGVQLAIYFVMQIMLVAGTLQDRWPLGDLIFAAFFLIVGQVILYVFSERICTALSHYLDGLFFATVCNLLAVMMVYKYWDSITREDLEFSVGTRMNNWEVKELLPDEDRRATVYQDDPYGSQAALHKLASHSSHVQAHSFSTQDNYPPSAAARYSQRY